MNCCLHILAVYIWEFWDRPACHVGANNVNLSALLSPCRSHCYTTDSNRLYGAGRLSKLRMLMFWKATRKVGGTTTACPKYSSGNSEACRRKEGARLKFTRLGCIVLQITYSKAGEECVSSFFCSMLGTRTPGPEIRCGCPAGLISVQTYA